MNENDHLSFLGYVVNKFKTRRKRHHRTLQDLRNLYGKELFDGVLADLNDIAVANDEGLPLIEYKPKSDSADYFRGFAEQVRHPSSRNKLPLPNNIMAVGSGTPATWRFLPAVVHTAGS